MRFLAKWLSVWACIGLILMPASTLHAHFDTDHRQVLVHGGHDHDLDHGDAAEVEFNARHDEHERHDVGHLAVHRDSHEAPTQLQRDNFALADSISSAEVAAVSGAPHHVHVVNMQSTKFDAGFKRWTPLISTVPASIDVGLDTPSVRIDSSRDEDRIVRTRSYLHPPLRGPPIKLR